MQEIIGASAFRKLQEFTSTSNSQTGIAHDLDKERWFDFVIEVHRNGSAERLYEEELRGWFTTNAWNADMAEYLAKEFTNQCKLLAIYDQIER